MEDSRLYHQIADSIRHDILIGKFKPGERLPSIRRLCEKWNCTPGTVQRAYQELAREGLLVSRAGRGTQVAGQVSKEKGRVRGALRIAHLVNRSESFLLEALTAGYDLSEIQQAVDMAMDRWRSLSRVEETASPAVLRFAGSHDMALNELARSFNQIAQGVTLQLTYLGSLGGLIALAEGKADLAGCHLWDAETGTYNVPYIHRLLPGKALHVITFAHRRQGLMVMPGNPLMIRSLQDLARPDVRFVNRQPGSGTRVWLDAALSRLGMDPSRIQGYADERLTHSDTARAVADGIADAGLGLENAALAYELDFIPLLRERYDLVMRAGTAEQPAVQQLVFWLSSPEGRQFIDRRPGYESTETGTSVAI